MTDLIQISSNTGKWSVRVAGAVIAESDAVLELREGDFDPVLYFPKADVAMALLDKTEKTTVCAHKGTAHYFTVHTKSGPLQDAAWSYEDPNAAVKEIDAHLAFSKSEKVTIEQI